MAKLQLSAPLHCATTITFHFPSFSHLSGSLQVISQSVVFDFFKFGLKEQKKTQGQLKVKLKQKSTSTDLFHWHRQPGWLPSGEALESGWLRSRQSSVVWTRLRCGTLSQWMWWVARLGTACPCTYKYNKYKLILSTSF